MKKKFLSFVLAICFILPCAFFMVGCNDDPPPTDPPMTNEEMSTTYKDIAKSTWSEIGVDDPTVSASAVAYSVFEDIPDKKQETSISSDLLNIKLNANSLAGLLYMIGLLYENDNFSTTNNIAVFDASVTMGITMTQNYILKTSLDKQSNKVYLEAIITTSGNEQYSAVEMNYNFDTKTLVSFRFASSIMGSMFIDMELTADNKNMFYATADAEDTFAVALEARKESLKTSASSVQKISIDFGTIVQQYLNIVQEVSTQLQ